MAVATETEATLRGIVAEVLDIPEHSIVGTQSLRAMGMDSLATVELKDEIDRSFGVNLAMGVLERDTDFAGLVTEVTKLVSDGTTSVDGTVESKSIAPQYRSVTQWFQFPDAFVGSANVVDGHPDHAAAFPRAVKVLRSGIENGWQTGAQLYVSRDGVPLARVALGVAHGDTHMTNDTMVPWLCNAKQGLTIAFAQLWEAGAIELDSTVASVIGEFGCGGKERITFRHLLTHTTGLRPDPAYEAPQSGRDEVFAAICAAQYPKGSLPGFDAYYSGITSFFLLGTAIERISGLSLDRYVSERVFGPLGIDSAYTWIPEDDFETSLDRIAPLFQMDPHRRVFPMFASPIDFAAFLPGVNGGGSATSLAKLYESLLPTRHVLDEPLLSSQTREAIAAKHRVGMYDVHWKGFFSHGLGVIADAGLLGRYCSPRAFGYGTHSSTAVADPEHKLVLVALVNGMTPGTGRERAIVDAVYEDLGITAQPTAAPHIVAVEPERVPDWSAMALREDRYWIAPQS